MKLLVDENLSPDLVALLVDRFPGTTHVRLVGLASAPDPVIWEYAKVENFAIITQDSDFRQRSFLYGAPPKIIWVRKGNASADVVLSFVALRMEKIEEFLSDPDNYFLVLQ